MSRVPGTPRRQLLVPERNLPRWVVRNTAVRAQRPGLGGRMPLRWQRRYLDLASSSLALPAGSVVRPTTLGGVPAERITVGATERPRAVLYLHGGAFITGSLTSHRSLAAFLAHDAEAVVYPLAYPLAPEHPFPAALDAAVAAYDDLLRQGWSPSQLVIAGDSAGGGLAVAACQRITAADPSARPAALALISPAVDIRVWDGGVTRRQARLDPVVRMRWGDASRLAYVGTGDVEDIGITPTQGPLDKLPPMIVHVDQDELLHDRVVEFARRAEELGVDVRLHEYARTWHVMHAHASLWPVAREAIRELGAFVHAATP